MRSFYPWIAFAALSSVSWLWSAIVGFLVAVALILRARRSHIAWDALILEASSTGFFVIVSAVALTSPDSTLRHYSGAGSLAWLALVAWIKLAARKPFTLGIAKQSTPAELWHQPRFLQVNMIHHRRLGHQLHPHRARLRGHHQLWPRHDHAGHRLCDPGRVHHPLLGARPGERRCRNVPTGLNREETAMTSNLPHLAGNYAPVAEELTAYDLPTTGAIPPELTGWYLRNGPEPARRRVRLVLRRTPSLGRVLRRDQRIPRSANREERTMIIAWLIRIWRRRQERRRRP